MVRCQITAARYKYHSGLVFLWPLTYPPLFILLSFFGYAFPEARETNGLCFGLIALIFSSHIPRKDTVSHPPSSTLPRTPLPHLPLQDEGMRSTATNPQQSNISAPISFHGTQLPYFPLHVAKAHRAGEQVPSHPTDAEQGDPYSLLWRSQSYSQSSIPLYICCGPATWFHINIKKVSTLQPKWSSGFTLQHILILQPAG